VTGTEDQGSGGGRPEIEAHLAQPEILISAC
jgi:hypothetical protein